MKRILLALVASALTSVPASAENVPVVVELFTSQGCSSCPPADDLMRKLAAREDVIALSLHVDYWDYIGWKDEFADPRNAKRQRGYAAVAGRKSIYTPETIVNGVSDIVGARPMDLAMAIEKHKAETKPVALELSPAGPGRIAISAQPLASGLEAMDVVLLRYQVARSAQITRGENAGRTLEYINVTQDWEVLSQWDGSAPLALEAQATGPLPVVVLIQSRGYGPIRAAARLLPDN